MKKSTNSNTVVLFQTVVNKSKALNWIIDRYTNEFQGMNLDGVKYYFPKDKRVDEVGKVKSMKYGNMEVIEVRDAYVLQPIIECTSKMI